MLFDPIDENVHLLPTKQKGESKIYTPMKRLVPTLFPFIKLWDSNDKSSPDHKSKDQKSETKTT
jgi:hypothetical protein